MAADPILEPEKTPNLFISTTASSYLGLSFAIFLATLPHSTISFVTSLQSQNRSLTHKLLQAEEEINFMKSRRKEDYKANARVVEIFASHRNGWQMEEKKLIQQIDRYVDEITCLRARVEELEKTENELRICVEKLEREVDEGDEMINFMSRQVRDVDEDIREEEEEAEEEEVEEEEENEEAYFSVRSVDKMEVKEETEIRDGYGRRCLEEDREEFLNHCVDYSRFGEIRIPEECFLDLDDGGKRFADENGFGRDFLASASKIWADRQDMRYESVQSKYHVKPFVPRESPWKVDGESTGVPSKMKLLEQELLNLEKVDKSGLSKIPSLLRKQTKRYKALAGKIDDLCRRMQANDPCESTLSTEFRTRRQTEFLLEAYRLHQRSIETGQKLTALQSDIAKSNFSHDGENHGKLNTRRSLECIRNNLREIQRNLEIWLARITGDLEGILARDGTSRVKDYYLSSYPFVRYSPYSCIQAFGTPCM